MRKTFLLPIIVLSTFFYGQSQVDNNLPLVVLELFTSQGCSSCPPADELLDNVQTENEDKIIALSYHVDYWNYIGWKDPFSKAIFTEKQKAYGKKFYSSSIYTPQVVVNGKEHFVGSNASKMKDKIKLYSKSLPSNSIAISNLKRKDSDINFDYTVTGTITDKVLRLILVIKERITIVKRGENRNRTLKNSNIVVEEVYLKTDAKTGKAHLKIPKIITKADNLAIVALVQSENLDITGGTQITL
ncbi:DUF1223 domain-containing protein [Hyunsoonleella pacifica]|uniref:DUF1223 domain-containing protein n=1 Tax=Hyunsoonleella pacifica TaxID=1080224 RepID=A0A4Q9FR20_9FLAO|nr:DUF1223 domain-containing protein [Hyunsoonleella pacifica]TBN17921.1 DUF1223 domain-containing protein [Hyunsoonleella pacifica]GGD07801.1 hypothetical protein GCM10011368_07160 [Hyunsoonleella pacifica]